MKKRFVTELVVVLLVVALLAAVVVLSTTVWKRSSAEGVAKDVSVSARRSVFERTDKEKEEEPYLETYIAACGEMDSILTVSDLNLSADLTRLDVAQPFGLFIYDGEKNVPYTTEGVFDEKKKTIFYAHGMGGNGSWNNLKGFYDLGYNVLCFYWGAFADEENSMFASLCNKVWFRGEKRYHTADGKGWQRDDSPDLSVAEIYATFYLDLLGKHPTYDSKEIVVSGHSYGGMLTTALLSYLTTAYGNGLIDARVLPDRALLCDPFFVGGDIEGTVGWLNGLHPPKIGGTVFFSRQALVAAHKAGISVTLFRTSNLIVTAYLLAYPMDRVLDAIDEFNYETFFIDANALNMPHFDMTDAHNYGRYWPTQQTYELYDANNPGEYSYSLLNPYHSEFARVHESYTLDHNRTAYVFDDDKLTYDTPEKTKLYGFVYVDENENGIFDERIASHVVGATITIKDADGTVVYREKTGMNGYFEIPAVAGTYTIEVQLPGKLTLSKTLDPVTVTEQADFVFCPIAVQP